MTLKNDFDCFFLYRQILAYTKIFRKYVFFYLADNFDIENLTSIFFLLWLEKCVFVKFQGNVLNVHSCLKHTFVTILSYQWICNWITFFCLLYWKYMCLWNCMGNVFNVPSCLKHTFVTILSYQWICNWIT